jgi:hypothetical protein
LTPFRLSLLCRERTGKTFFAPAGETPEIPAAQGLLALERRKRCAQDCAASHFYYKYQYVKRISWARASAAPGARPGTENQLSFM